MQKIKRNKHGPEWYIQKELVGFLQTRGWLVEVMHGNAFQKGIPDLYLFRRDIGHRWVDVKQPKKYTFTKAQRIKWPTWERAGNGIWIMVAATQEEYDKLFAPPNWLEYWKDSWSMPTEEEMDSLLDTIRLDE
jgi:hypothetical protein